MRRWLIVTSILVLAGCGGAGFLLPFDPAPLVGNYTGNWQNQTFSTTGGATMSLSTNSGAQTATMVLDLNGSVFGGADPAAVTMNGTYNDNGMTVTGTTTVFGQMTFSVNGAGVVSGSAPNVPGSTVDSMSFFGTISNSGANITYTLAMAGGGNATGTLTLTK